MMELFEPRIIKLARFLNSKELICILYCYIKTGYGTEALFHCLEDRVVLLIDTMSMYDVKKIMTIISNK